MSVPHFSALHFPPRGRPHAVKQSADLIGWDVETEHQEDGHPCFDDACGEYKVCLDGLYTVVVELIPIGSANVENQSHRRLSVDYVVRIQEPPEEGISPDDVVESEYKDVGSVNFAEMIHLKEGTRISCMQMPSSRGTECVRFKIELLQRKRKRARAPEVSKKELKKRKKLKRKAESSASSQSAGLDITRFRYYNSGAETSKSCDSSDDSSDSDWSNGFESDTSEDLLPHSSRGVKRLAKRFKSTTAPDLN